MTTKFALGECERCHLEESWYNVKITQSDHDGDTSDPEYAKLCHDCFHEISIGFRTGSKRTRERRYCHGRPSSCYVEIGKSRLRCSHKVGGQ